MIELGKYVSFDYNGKKRVGLVVPNPASHQDDDSIVTLDLDVDGVRVEKKTFKSFNITNIDNVVYCRRKQNIEL